MPNYNYECDKCGKLWDEIHSIADRDRPISKPCPHCKKRGGVRKSWAECTPGLGADWTLTPNKATGGRWNELMAKIERGQPKSQKGRWSKGNNAKGTRWR